MTPNIPQAVRHLITEYRRFPRTSYRFLDLHSRAQLEGHLDRADAIVRGPNVTLARDPVLGKALQELPKRGPVNGALLRFRLPGGSEPLSNHQQRALNSRTPVVATAGVRLPPQQPYAIAPSP